VVYQRVKVSLGEDGVYPRNQLTLGTNWSGNLLVFLERKRNRSYHERDDPVLEAHGRMVTSQGPADLILFSVKQNKKVSRHQENHSDGKKPPEFEMERAK